MTSHLQFLPLPPPDWTLTPPPPPPESKQTHPPPPTMHLSRRRRPRPPERRGGGREGGGGATRRRIKRLERNERLWTSVETLGFCCSYFSSSSEHLKADPRPPGGAALSLNSYKIKVLLLRVPKGASVGGHLVSLGERGHSPFFACLKIIERIEDVCKRLYFSIAMMKVTNNKMI